MSYVPEVQGTPDNAGDLAGLQYAEAYAYVFRNQNWPMNLLLCGVCQLIPIIGPIVMIGYQFEIIEALYRHRGAGYPDFDFNSFVEYLKRGLWPFLVNVIVGAVVSVPLSFLFMMISLASALIGLHGPPAFSILGMGTGALTTAAGLVLVSFLVVPIFLRAGLTQDLSAAFDLEFVKHFVKVMWKEMLVGALFMVGSGMAAAAVGLLVCCVGVYAAAALIMLAQANLYYQLYRIYLARGGMPIPLKGAPIEPQV